MDSSTAAAKIGTTPKVLRRFLRSSASSFRAVGSGARYDFRESDIDRLRKEFNAWSSGRCEVPTVKAKESRRGGKRTKISREDRDRAVWAEEDQQRGGPLILPNINDPRVRAAVRAEAIRQEAVLAERLMAVGLHISQPGWDRNRKAS
jgi:hypothetical protein